MKKLVRLFLLASIVVLGTAGDWAPGADYAQAQNRDQAWLGVSLQELNKDLRDAIGVSRRVKGALITSVVDGSPADKAGLRSHDVITEIDNIRVTSVDQAIKAVRTSKPGSKVRVVVQRGDKERGINVRLGDLSDASSGDRSRPRGPRNFFFDGDDDDHDRDHAPHARNKHRDRHDHDDHEGTVYYLEDDGSWTSSDGNEVWVDEDEDGRHVIRLRKEGKDAPIVIFRGDDDDDDGHSFFFDRDKKGKFSWHSDDDDDHEGSVFFFDRDKKDGKFGWHSDDDEDGNVLYFEFDDDEDDDDKKVKVHRKLVERFQEKGERMRERADRVRDRLERRERRAPSAQERWNVQTRSRGFLGVETMEVNQQLAEYFGAKDDHGVLVTWVVEDSPAEKAGLRAGDIILEVDGEEIEDSGDLAREIRRLDPGEETVIRFNRKGSERSLTIAVADHRDFGAVFPAPLADELAELRIPEIHVPPVHIPEIRIPAIHIPHADLEELHHSLGELEELEHVFPEMLHGLEGIEEEIAAALESIDFEELMEAVGEIDFQELAKDFEGIEFDQSEFGRSLEDALEGLEDLDLKFDSSELERWIEKLQEEAGKKSSSRRYY
ncbi:MAG: PDZ domain-containing protein [Candidatus Eisenbacteria bacterium]|uniref:PDZ domain-containing protein n=1 Tax=Eiseniibacteriota bacterium TaxID=2212470 RepID=A0A7Y2E698_UNCEI|nr:PDZ domain-containing protein [Candidatus Eisenbacteria bacterium]